MEGAVGPREADENQGEWLVLVLNHYSQTTQELQISSALVAELLTLRASTLGASYLGSIKIGRAHV